MTTIKDVAKLAGVSPATASQALNGRPRVNRDTRQRVIDAAAKLRYAPNLNGRRLARRRAESIAVIPGRNVSTVFSDSFYRAVMGGVTEATQARGYSLVITPAASRGSGQTSLPQILGHGAVDGALVAGVLDEQVLLALRERGLPVVLVDTYLPGVPVPAVMPDYRTGARLATEHLLHLGHRRVGFLGAAVGYPFGWHTYEGYTDALAARGVAQEAGLVRRSAIDVVAATAETAALLHLPAPPTAVFAVTDAMAIGALRAARERGVAVPAGLAVVGMDDIELSAYTDPPLTTVRIAKDELGRLGAERLIGLIEGDDTGPALRFVGGELVVRESCGARSRAASIEGALDRSGSRGLIP